MRLSQYELATEVEAGLLVTRLVVLILRMRGAHSFSGHTRTPSDIRWARLCRILRHKRSEFEGQNSILYEEAGQVEIVAVERERVVVVSPPWRPTATDEIYGHLTNTPSFERTSVLAL